MGPHRQSGNAWANALLLDVHELTQPGVLSVISPVIPHIGYRLAEHPSLHAWPVSLWQWTKCHNSLRFRYD